MTDWQARFIDHCKVLDHATVGKGAFQAGPAVLVGKRDVAHFDDDCTLDVRLTRSVIRARRAELNIDARVRLRPGSDWLEVRMTDERDSDFALSLIRDAIEANRHLVT